MFLIVDIKDVEVEEKNEDSFILYEVRKVSVEIFKVFLMEKREQNCEIKEENDMEIDYIYQDLLVN